MLLLPAPTSHFIFAAKPVIERIHYRRHMFWYKMNHIVQGRHLLGSFDGDSMRDDDFRRKLKRIKALLDYRGVHYEESNFVINDAEAEQARKLSQDQKRIRKHSAVMNKYIKLKTEISESNDLFKADKLIHLEEDLKNTLAKLATMYLID